ncbi:MAG: polyamine ABC transporter substrate-binding protein [Xanthomonadales bacterium]|nr:polyamine ABC transporter substrate-binding protein [Xanthomonadales bacterium]
MNRPHKLLLLFLLICSIPTLLNAAEEKELNVYNWADYIGPDTIANFEKEFGIKVNYDLYDSTEVVEAKLLAGRTGYDVVMHSARYSARLIPIGVYQPLQKDQLPLWGNLDPWVLDVMAGYDPGNTYGMPYMWGSTGYAINVEMVKARMPDAPLGSAAMLFDPKVVSKFTDCGVSFIDEPTDVIPMVLQYLGHDPNSLEPDDMAEVEATLKSVRPYIRYFSSTKMINDLPNQEVCVAMSWSGDYAQAMNRALEVGVQVDLAYYTPKEGWVYWFDGVFITSDAPHPDNAHLFLNYLLRPEVMADISNETRYGNANLAAKAFMDTAVVNDPAAYPSDEARQHAAIGYIFGPKEERRRTRSWSRIKTGL